MAKFADLTKEQQATYQAFEREVRAWCGSLQRLLNGGRALNDSYNGQMVAILADLDTDEIPPNTSGLSGSQALKSDSEMVTLVSHIQGVLGSYDSDAHRQMRAKAAGVNATFGVE